MLRKRAGAHKKLRHGVEPEAPSEDFEDKPGCWSEPRARSGGPASESSKKASMAKGAKAAEGSAWPRRVLGDRLQVGCTRQLGGEAAVDWAGQIQRLFQLQGDLWMI